ncbi:hypothetical protein RSOLAG1IB_08251 [Rhizoctonia solani AG-1 IB]|uniref:C2H2-type domain-containing protein n=1 Tax=Thanatephorus cucumeris (strain AG1-IB / isolate 7/3/14) TaxID=1108050 RepID=A0A0B7FL99_THACB|nr:hypothetical protein RSOLAG1IB_08251 [Rhizoctonia solani AG-1 IB]
MTLATCSLSQEAAAVGDRGVSGQLPYSIPFSGLSYSLKPQGNTPRTTDDTHNLRRHAIASFARQVNLATNLDCGDSIGPSTIRYEYPQEFHAPFDQAAYQQYVHNSTRTQVEGSEVQTFPNVGYGYTESPATVEHNDTAAQPNQDFDFNFQPTRETSYLDTQPLGELYLGNSHNGPLDTEGPYQLLLERKTSGMTLSEGESQPSFIISFDGTPLDKDAWSSVAFSSPSLASFNSSPSSTQHDSSALGTPSLGFEDSSVSPAEPLLSHPISYSIPDLRHLSNSPANRDALLRQRRGAIARDNAHIFPSQDEFSSRQLLDDNTARHIYAEGFEPDDSSDSSLGPLTSERSHTPLTSPSNSSSPGFTYAQVTNASTEFSNPSGHGNTTREPIPKNDPSHTVPLIRRASSRSTDGRGQSGGSRHHPYGRSSKVSEHEQVIQFDTPVSVSTASNSGHTEADSRKSKKKSKGPKRVYCEYICPLKGEPCGQSVSREADMSRHMQRHRRAEETMVRDGLLSLDQQTIFENLKADEITLCKRCGETLSRKDALRRHLKNAGKACRSFYPEIIIAD